MKILYITYDGILDPLGQSQILPYIKGLGNKEAKITVLSFEKPEKLSNKKLIDGYKTDMNNVGISWIKLAYHKRPPIPATLYDLLRGLLICLWVVRKQKIRIVHCRGYLPSIIGYILKILLKPSFLFDVRGFWADEKVDAGAWSTNSMVYRVFKRMEKRFFLKADQIVVLTNIAKSMVQKFSYLKNSCPSIQVIPTCVDLKRFKPIQASPMELDIVKDRFVILYIGSLGTFYCLDQMIEFFFELTKWKKNALFFFLSNTSPDLITEKMREKGIPESSYLITHAPYEEVPLYISKANITISFIKPTFSKKSSCPTKFAESLACGVPVIINKGIGDCDEVVVEEKVGVVVNHFTPQAYQRAIEEMFELLLDGELLSERCRKTAFKYFSLDDGVEKYWEIYKRLTDRGQEIPFLDADERRLSRF